MKTFGRQGIDLCSKVLLYYKRNDEKRRAFKIGDEILFIKEPQQEETLSALIIDKYVFKDFEEMAEGLDKIKPFTKKTNLKLIAK